MQVAVMVVLIVLVIKEAEVQEEELLFIIHKVHLMEKHKPPVEQQVVLVLKLEEQERKRDALAGEKKKIEWSSQIRSYTFQPYTLVKDHRTSHETGNVQAVMDGEISGFIDAYLLVGRDGTSTRAARASKKDDV